MKSLRDALHINDAKFQRLDAGEKSLIQILALTVPASALVAAIVLYFAIKLLMGSTFFAMLGGGFIGYIFYLHDSSLLAQSGKGRAWARLITSMMLAVVMAVPLKVSVIGEDLSDVVKQDIRQYNLDVDKKLLVVKQDIYDEEKEIMERITEAGRRYADSKNSQELVEARRAKESFDKQKEKRLEALDNTYNAFKKSEEVSRLDLASYYFTNMFSPRSTKEFFINISVFFLLLLVEALPAIIRLKLESGEYLSKLKHEVAMQKRTDLEVEKLENELLSIEDLKAMPERLEKIKLWKALDDASKKGFSDTDELYKLASLYAKKAKENPPQTQSTPPAPSKSPKPSENGKPNSNDEFADFDYQ
jgi:hypothetical protein